MTRILGRSSTTAAEDPFTAPDPTDVARLVRRALAAAGRKAFDVVAFVVVSEREVDADGLARLARRALGPHGSALDPVGRVSGAVSHDERCREVAERAGVLLAEPYPTAPGTGTLSDGVAIAIALGPGLAATALCVGSTVRDAAGQR